MDDALRKAVEKCDIEAVRQRLAELDIQTLPPSPLRFGTVLHIAGAQRTPSCLPIVELLTDVMSVEQVSAMSINGTVVQEMFNCRDDDADWGRKCQRVTVKIMEKMTEKAALCSESGLSAIFDLCGNLQLDALRVAFRRFGDAIAASQHVRRSMFFLLSSRRVGWPGGEENEATLHQVMDLTDEELFDDAEHTTLRMTRSGLPASAIIRVLKHPVNADHHHGSSARGSNVLHGIAMTGREELLDEVMPYITPAYLEQRHGYYGHTPLEIARRQYDRTGEEVYLRLAGRLQTFVKSAVD